MLRLRSGIAAATAPRRPSGWRASAAAARVRAQPRAPVEPPRPPLPQNPHAAAVARQDFAGKSKHVWFYPGARSAAAPFRIDVERDENGLETAHSRSSQPSPLQRVLRFFLPENYATSVTRHYMPFTKWQAAQSVLGSSAGVLSTQSLLYAVGLGQSSAIPAAAAMNWVLKDGLGQLGGVLFNSWAGSRFDADPKRLRFVSALALNVAILIEILTPLVPQYFLLLAGVANVFKNVSWLATSSTKASFHRSFLRAENLGDLTAKSGSQNIAASIVGTGLGISLSFLVGTQTVKVVTAFALIAAAHIFCTYRSLLEVAIGTLNPQRFELLLVELFNAGRVVSPDDVRQREQFVRPYASPLGDLTKLVVGPDLQTVVRSPVELEAMVEAAAGARYLVKLQREPLGKATVFLLFFTHATGDDVVCGYAHATRLRYELRRAARTGESDREAEAAAASWTAVHLPELLRGLQAQGWNTEHTFLETRHARIELAARAVQRETEAAEAAAPHPHTLREAHEMHRVKEQQARAGTAAP